MTAPALRPGDVVLLFDGTVRPPKHKRFLCVVVAEGWFLRINSRPHFPPHVPISAAANPGCLDYDSFVELRGVIELDMGELAEALDRREARILGRIGAWTAAALVAAVEAAPTLNAAEKAAIAAALRALD